MEEDVEIEILYKSNEKLLLEAAKDTSSMNIMEINHLENYLSSSSKNSNLQYSKENVAGDIVSHNAKTSNDLAETKKISDSCTDNDVQILKNQEDHFTLKHNNSLSLKNEELLQKVECVEGAEDEVNQHILDLISTDPVKYYLSQQTSYIEQFEGDDEEYESTDDDWEDYLGCKDGDFIDNMLEQAESKSHKKTQFPGNKILQRLETKALPALMKLGKMLLKRSNLLLALEHNLQQLSRENKCRQKKLREDLMGTEKTKTEGSISGRFCFRKFGMPYFSDEKGFGAPPNVDQLQKLENDELMIDSMPKANNWSKSHKRLLEKEIKRALIAEKSAKLTKEITKLIETTKNKDSDHNQTVEKIIEKQNELRGIYKKSLKELVKNENVNREYDWMKFSVSLFDGQHSAEECRRFWNLYLKPSINKAAWSESEDLQLSKVASQSNYQDWEKIAKLLGTDRSGFQCFVHYNSRLNESSNFSSGKWTNVEDKKLVTVVNSAKVGEFIPWTKVSSYMGNRNHNQIYNRWANSLNPDLMKGRFSKEEDILIVAAIEVFDVTFKELALFMNNRTSSQIRERYERYLLPKTKKVGTWSLEEDEKLLKLVEEYGSQNWSKIANEMKTRTRTQVRQRYGFIQKMRKKNPGWTIAQVKRRNIYGSARADKTNRNIASIKKVVGEVEKVFQMTDIEKGTFMIQKLGELKEKISVRLLGNRGRKRKMRSVSNEINDKLVDFFMSCSLSSYSESSELSLKEADNSLDELFTIAKFLGHELRLPKSEEEVWESPSLSFDSKCFLSFVTKTHVEHTSQLNVSSKQQACPNNQLIVRKSCPVERIDCPIPVQDDTIIMNEWWHTPPVNVASLNFSEFFKRTVFDYSNGMHKDIWESKMSRRQVVDIGHDYAVHEEVKSPISLNYNFPPNQFTTLGMRSLLLSRALTERMAFSDSFIKEELNVDEDIKVTQRICSQLENDLQTLFTWPMVLSVTKKKISRSKAQCSKKSHGNLSKDMKSYSKTSFLKRRSEKNENAKDTLLENTQSEHKFKKQKLCEGSLHSVRKSLLKNQRRPGSEAFTKRNKTDKEKKE